jgi:hypothetical protein
MFFPLAIPCTLTKPEVRDGQRYEDEKITVPEAPISRSVRKSGGHYSRPAGSRHRAATHWVCGPSVYLTLPGPMGWLDIAMVAVAAAVALVWLFCVDDKRKMGNPSRCQTVNPRSKRSSLRYVSKRPKLVADYRCQPCRRPGFGAGSRTLQSQISEDPARKSPTWKMVRAKIGLE